MDVNQIITLIIGLGGWIFVGIQFFVNRKWQKKDRIKEQRYAAYNAFMEKLDSINSVMKTDPSSSIFALTSEFVEEIRKGAVNDPAQVMSDFGKKLLEQTKKSVEPLMMVQNEINSMRLIASPALLVKLEELKMLCTDLYNEMMRSLSKISGPQLEEFQQLKTIGQQERWKRFGPLNEEIVSLMRKEVGV
jgi:hypothetical protein